MTETDQQETYSDTDTVFTHTPGLTTAAQRTQVVSVDTFNKNHDHSVLMSVDSGLFNSPPAACVLRDVINTDISILQEAPPLNYVLLKYNSCSDLHSHHRHRSQVWEPVRHTALIQ